MQASPIFSRTYDLLLWLLPVTARFPRQQRFVLAEAVQRAALGFQESIIEAGQTRQAAALQEADTRLAALRVYLRLSHDLRLLSGGQYEHVARMVDEIGRLLGGWKKTIV
jgi:four helix bundle protein